MPVAVACPCGAKLRVPDTAAGKRVKCPKCGDVLTVPAAEYEVVDDPPPVKKTVAKPKRVPLEVDEPVEDDRPKAKRRRDREDEDDATRRKGKKAKSSLPLLLGVGGGAFVLLAVVGIIVAVVMSGGEGQAKATLPAAQTSRTTPAGPPAGWKEFRADGMRVWVPEGVALKQLPTQGSLPLLAAGTSWTNMDPNDPAKPSGPAIAVEKGRLDPQTAAAFRQEPAAAWERAYARAKQMLDQKEMKVVMSDAKLGFEPAKQFAIPMPAGGHITSRVVVKGDVVYTATAMHEGEAESDMAASAFFNSFTIEDAVPPTGDTKPAGDPAEWKAFNGDGFTLMLPDGFAMRENDTLGQINPNAPKLEGWSTDVPGVLTTVAFAVMKGKVNPTLVEKFDEMPEASWRSIVKAHSKAAEGETVSEARVVKSAAGLEGREFTKQRAEGRQTVRFYMAGGHLYTLMVVQVGRDVKDDPRAERFLASFRPE